jgi:hypothetical protein
MVGSWVGWREALSAADQLVEVVPVPVEVEVAIPA